MPTAVPTAVPGAVPVPVPWDLLGGAVPEADGTESVGKLVPEAERERVGKLVPIGRTDPFEGVADPMLCENAPTEPGSEELGAEVEDEGLGWWRCL